MAVNANKTRCPATVAILSQCIRSARLARRTAPCLSGALCVPHDGARGRKACGGRGRSVAPSASRAKTFLMTRDQRENKVAAPFGGLAGEGPRSLGTQPIFRSVASRARGLRWGRPARVFARMRLPARTGEDFFRNRSIRPQREKHGPNPLVAYQRRHSRGYRKLGSTDSGRSRGSSFRPRRCRH